MPVRVVTLLALTGLLAFSLGATPSPGGVRLPSDHRLPVLSSTPAASAAGRDSSKCSRPVTRGWLRTSGHWIVSADGCHVRLVGTTWYGMETTNYAPAGLNIQSYAQILTTMKHLGFNSIRIPLSDELVRYNSKIRVKRSVLAKNRSLWNMHPLQLLKILVNEATKAHLMVILDNHYSVALPPPKKKSSTSRASIHRADDATWTSPGYTEKDWIHDWLIVARMFRNNPTVIGFDLRNEPHTDGPGPWSVKTYLKQGATWGPYPNKAHPSKAWSPATDWVAAAEKAGDAIQTVDPNALLFVEGVELYPDPPSACWAVCGSSGEKRGVEAYWWGGILRGVLVDPVHFSIGHHLVYSPHEYGPMKCCSSGQFNYRTSYTTLSKLFEANWAFILDPKNKSEEAPLWLGEFDTCNTGPACVSGGKRGSQGQWWEILMKYLRDHREIGWCYYPINGTNASDERSTNSVLNRTWTRVALPQLGKDLQSIEH